MSEEIEGQDTGAEAVAGGADPVAVALALGGASREDARAFLKKQGALIDDQRHHLHEQLKQLHLGIWEKRIGVMLRLATLVVGIAIAAGLGLMVWDAAHSKGLLIEPFSVPPDMAAKGLTGQVVAAQLLDKLAVMTASESSRSTQSYANNWGNDIKVEIPETGVSISELENFLREWLGHDTRISGEVYRTATGIAVTTRAGANGATFAGAEGELDALVQKGAEHVFESTQPYRYANYLDRNYDPKGAADRVARATAIYKRLIAGDDPVERAWAWNGLGTIATGWQSDSRGAEAYYRKALEQVPDFTIGYYALGARCEPLDQEEAWLTNLRQSTRLLHRDSIPDLNPHYVPNARILADSWMAALTGDFAAAVPIFHQGAELPTDFSVLSREAFYSSGITALSRQHDLGAVHAWMRELGWREIPMSYYEPRAWVDLESRNWPDLRLIETVGRKGLLSYRNGLTPGEQSFGLVRPVLALARAEQGDFAGAEDLIAPMPGDNDGAVRVHAQIAELEGQRARADWWFARSEAQTPSIPFTDALWGAALLKRGQPDAAIEKFKLSNQKGPHFADPLEGWGEALMARNRSDLALAKFAEAEKYAPNWGRLHLKWGEALGYAGKPQDAKAQFARAATLGLTPSEKFELAQASHG